MGFHLCEDIIIILLLHIHQCGNISIPFKWQEYMNSVAGSQSKLIVCDRNILPLLRKQHSTMKIYGTSLAHFSICRSNNSEPSWLAELFCYLTGNILGVEVSCG